MTDDTPAVTLTYLANEGVMLRAGDSAVIIDGLHRFYGAAYAVLPAKERLRLESARDGYADVDVVVATHRHGDHFSPEAVASHLRANPAARFVAAPQPVAELLALDDSHGIAAIRDRVHEASWVVGETRASPTSDTQPDIETDIEPDIEIEFLGLRHVGERHKTVHNFGVLVTMAGMSFLHIGDAAHDAANFSPFELPGRELTAVIVPSWFVSSASARRVVTESIAARHVFIAHIDPRASRADVAELARAMAGSVPLTEMLASFAVTREAVRPE